MKIEKNKIVFVAVLLCIVLFIVGYAMLVIGKDETPTIETNQIPIPELEEGQAAYSSKLEALDALKEARQINAPSIYDERLLDSTGVYDPDLLEKEKKRMVDSIYSQGRINYMDKGFRKAPVKTIVSSKRIEKDTTIKKEATDGIEENETKVAAKELSLEHQLFFASHPIENDILNTQNTDALIYVRVDGTQTVKTNSRLHMRLAKAAYINDILMPKNTAIYGVITFKPNRAIIAITSINHRPVKLIAFDVQDGSEGAYVENSFRAEATNEVLGDMVDDINITGLPQISGVRKIFQRNQRNVKVTVTNNYQLLLKTSKPTLSQKFGNPKTKLQ
ncbi:MAG: conjugative transposon protein TraM [Algibacter sp.]